MISDVTKVCTSIQQKPMPLPFLVLCHPFWGTLWGPYVCCLLVLKFDESLLALKELRMENRGRALVPDWDSP